MKHFDTTSPRTEESKNYYFVTVSKQPKISAKEEKELITRIHQGDKKAQDRLVCSNLAFVISEVKKYQGWGLPLEDLIEEGNVGLVKAAMKVNPEKNNKFITYAHWWIKDAVEKAIEDYSKHAYDSLDISPYGEDDEETIADRIPQDCFAAPDTEAMEDSLEYKLSIAMHGTLKQKEIDILCQVFGLGCKKRKESELAAEYGLSRVRICQIIREAISKLRSSRYSEELRMCC